MSRRSLVLSLVVLLSGMFVGLAWAEATGGHTVGGIYHGPYTEIRSGPNYHHCWTEHSHGSKEAACTEYEGNVYYFYCQAEGTATHIHCTAYFDGITYGRHQTGAYVLCSNNQRNESAYASYGDGHGVCTHYRHD